MLPIVEQADRADFKAARQLEIKPENRIPALFDRLDQIDELVRRINTNALGEVPQLLERSCQDNPPRYRTGNGFPCPRFQFR